MPEEDNANTTATENTAEGDLAESPISEQEILAALQLDENLQPVTPPKEGEAQEKTEEVDSVSGDNAEEQVAEEDTGEGKVEGEEEAALEAEAESEEPKKGTAQYRIDQLIGRNTKLKEQVTELQTKLDAAAPVILQPSPNDPLSHLVTEAQVKAEMDTEAAWRRWCNLNPDGGEVPDKNGNMHEITAEQSRNRKVYAEDVLTLYGPARMQFLREKAQADAVAKAAYPELFDSNTKAAKIAAGFLQEYPEFTRVKNGNLIIGDAISGMRARLAKESGKSGNSASVAQSNGKTPGKPVPKLAPRPIKAGAVPSQKTTQKSAAQARLERQFMENPSDKGLLTAYLESTL